MHGRCRFALSGQHTLLKWIRIPSVDPARRESAIADEARQGIPCPLDQVVWSHSLISDDGLDLEVVLAAAQRDFAENFCASAEEAGFRPTHLVPSSLLLHRAFRHNYPEVEDNVLLLQVGARTTHLAFLEGEHGFVRPLRLGGGNLTQEVAGKLNLAWAEAEALKLQVFSREGQETVSSPERNAVQAAADRFGQRLQAEVVRCILHRRREPRAGQPVALYLTGGGSLLPGLVTALADTLKLPTEHFDPLRRVELSFAIDPQAAQNAAPFLADLVGLALLEEASPQLNLLPAPLLEKQALRRRRPMVLATAILAVAALLPVADHYRRLARETAQRTAALERQLRPVRTLAARNADNLARIAAGLEQITTLQRLAEAKFTWIDFMSDLQSRLAKVEDAWLERLRLVPAVAGAGGPDAPTATLDLAIAGCLLDRNNPLSKVSQDSYARVKSLQQSLAESRYVTAIKNERFDHTQPGLLRFDFTLVLNPQAGL